MAQQFTQSDLSAYLDEALAPDEMARIETAVRQDSSMLVRLAQILKRRDHGLHTLADIWRRHRLSCPPRQELGAYLLDALEPDLANYIYFHVTEVGCRFCAANLEDLRAEQTKLDPAQTMRRRRYFESSAGYLKRV